MCVIFFYVNSNPSSGGYKLILASNRDEFYARDTHYVTNWKGAEYVYGGIDLEKGREGGTWLAIGGRENTFKVGALLNLTGEPRPRDALGRGMIVTDYVKNFDDDHSSVNYTSQLHGDCAKYSAFNFIAIEIGSDAATSKIRICSNAPASVTEYEEGKCYGFSNSLPAVPFEKVRYGQKIFEKIVEEELTATSKQNYTRTSKMKLVNRLVDLMKSKKKCWPDPELQRRAPNWAEHLSAINCHVPNEGYGSRTHSVIVIDENDKMLFHEETMINPDNPKAAWQKTTIEHQYFRST